MDRLTGQADYCRERALSSMRAGQHELAARWFSLARSYRLAEQISGFLEWNAQRLEPPEAFVPRNERAL